MQGLGPLAYQWFKDGKRLSVATSSSPLLVLVDLAPGDAGSYHCQVSAALLQGCFGGARACRRRAHCLACAAC